MLDAQYIEKLVRDSLQEDVGGGDLTAALVAEESISGQLICRDEAVLCGRQVFDEVFRQLDPAVSTHWSAEDGDRIEAGQFLCRISGPARPILTGERSALNLLQTLSGTATRTRRYVQLCSGGARLLDTRKTIPGLRLAQKYAVRCGGGHNHRLGLYDGILIKENHLRSAESIGGVLTRAGRLAPGDSLIEVEVESLGELAEALEAGAKRVLLDNFPVAELRRAVAINAGRAELEASGGISEHNLAEIAHTGVDYVSMGTLTKDLCAVDYSLLFDE